MPPLPDLAGQPGWVVVLVSLFAAAGFVGSAWIRRRVADPGDGEDDQGGRSLEATRVPSIVAGVNGSEGIQTALNYLAQVAEREAAESREARAEASEHRREVQGLRDQLAACGAALAKAEADKERAEAHAELLIRQAYRHGEGGARDHG